MDDISNRPTLAIIFGDIRRWLPTSWLWMFEPPWQKGRDSGIAPIHWYIWSLGWVWVLAGMALGALVAPNLVHLWNIHTPAFVHQWRLSDAYFQEAIVIAFSLAAGFLVQTLGWLFLLAVVLFLTLVASAIDETFGTKLIVSMLEPSDSAISGPTKRPVRWWQGAITAVFSLAVATAIVVAILLPLVGVSYALYKYFTLVGPGQETVAIGVAGSLFLKLVLIPVLKTLVGGFAFARLLALLRRLGTSSKPK